MFHRNDKAYTSATIRKLVSMSYKGDGIMWESILDMCYLVGKLKGLKIELPEDVLVHLVLISLPPYFSQFEMSHNYQNEEWALNELISHLPEEED